MQTIDTLEVYLLAKTFRKEVVKTVNTFPKEEKFLLIAQIKDSARSITANIAEGYGRYHYQEAIQFCRIARGSLLETYDHLSSALDEEYITMDRPTEFKEKQEFLLKKNQWLHCLSETPQAGRLTGLSSLFTNPYLTI